MTIKIVPNDKGNPPGKLADAELHFTDGPLEGLKLIGFAVWERKTGNGRNVTFPARTYSVNGERRSFSLLRPIVDSTAQDRIRDLILQAYAEHEAAAGGRRRSAGLRLARLLQSTGRNFAFSFWRFGGSVHSSRRPLSNSGAEERRLHAAVDDVPGQHGVLRAVAEDVEVGVDARLRDGGAPLPPLRSAASIAGGDAPIAEREQRLVVRMPLRLDVEVHVVEARQQRAQPLALASVTAGSSIGSHW